MSAAESENPEPKQAQFVESDHAPTELPFDEGGVPLYVAVVWVLFLIGYVVYMAIYALPDFALWSKL